MPTVAFRYLVAHPGGPPGAAWELTAADEAGPVGTAAVVEEAGEEELAPVDADDAGAPAELDDDEDPAVEHPATAAAAAIKTRPVIPVSAVLRSVMSPRSSLQLTMRLMNVGTPL
jgi:hypothetical protein